MNLIDRFNDPVYARYKELFTSASSAMLEMIEPGKLMITEAKTQYQVTMPKYKQVSAEITNNTTEINRLYNIYVINKDRTVGKEIQKLSDRNFMLHQFKHLANSTGFITDRKTDLLMHDLSKIQTDMKKKNLTRKELVKLLEEEMHIKRELMIIGGFIDFYIDKLPVIEERDHKPGKATKPRKDKIKEKVVSSMMNTFPLNKFKFKTLEDCTTKAKSNPVYISKEDLITTIENDTDLKRIFPKNYKKLKKEEICDILFQPIQKI